MLSKSQQVFASAHKDFQRLTWNFHSEDQENAIANEVEYTLNSRGISPDLANSAYGLVG